MGLIYNKTPRVMDVLGDWNIVGDSISDDGGMMPFRWIYCFHILVHVIDA